MAEKKNNKSQTQHIEMKQKAREMNDLFREETKSPGKKLKVTLPIAPSVNHMYVNTRKGGRRLSSSAQNYFYEATAIINQAVDEQNWIKENDYIWYYLDICVYMPDRKTRDSHNMLKILIDAFQGEVFKNDYYVMPRIQKVEYDNENPRIEICLRKQLKKDREKKYL